MIDTRTPGGQLFEFATFDIGFAVDEPEDLVGHELLPPFSENRGVALIKPLESIQVPHHLKKVSF